MLLQFLMEGLWKSSHAPVIWVTCVGYLSARGGDRRLPVAPPCLLRDFAWGYFRLGIGLHPKGQLRVSGGIVKTTVKVLRNVVGSAGLVFMGYVVLSALPDLRRYIRISTM